MSSRTTRSAISSNSVASRLIITKRAPFRLAGQGNPAAGQTTREEPAARKRSQSRVSCSARRISRSGIACPKEIVAVLMWPPQSGQSGARSFASVNCCRTHDNSNRLVRRRRSCARRDGSRFRGDPFPASRTCRHARAFPRQGDDRPRCRRRGRPCPARVRAPRARQATGSRSAASAAALGARRERPRPQRHRRGRCARALDMARAGLGGFAHSRELGLAELEAARAATPRAICLPPAPDSNARSRICEMRWAPMRRRHGAPNVRPRRRVQLQAPSPPADLAR